jgi:hypothetical protein
VLPHSSYGKNHVPITASTYRQPLIRAHSQAITDFAFDRYEIFPYCERQGTHTKTCMYTDSRSRESLRVRQTGILRCAFTIPPTIAAFDSVLRVCTKLWEVPSDGLVEDLSTPVVSLSTGSVHVLLGHHVYVSRTLQHDSMRLEQRDSFLSSLFPTSVCVLQLVTPLFVDLASIRLLATLQLCVQREMYL